MKKAKLQIEPTFDFELLGIVSPIREYRMAWLVNQELELNLVKVDDLELEFLNSEKLEIAQYFLSLPHGFIQLLKNKALNSSQQLAYLIPTKRKVWLKQPAMRRKALATIAQAYEPFWWKVRLLVVGYVAL